MPATITRTAPHRLGVQQVGSPDPLDQLVAQPDRGTGR
jgi:hypothetical protein